MDTMDTSFSHVYQPESTHEEQRLNMDTSLDILRKLTVEYKLMDAEDALKLDSLDLYNIFASELETRLELEQSLKECYSLFTKRTEKHLLSDKVGLNTKIWYQQYLSQVQQMNQAKRRSKKNVNKEEDKATEVVPEC